MPDEVSKFAKILNDYVSSKLEEFKAYVQSVVKNHQIGSNQIMAEAVIGPKIKNKSINASAKLMNDSITIDNMANNSVGTSELVGKSVTNAKIGDLAVGTGQLANASVTNVKIGDLAVGTGNLAAQSVTQAKMANDSVGSAQIITGAVGVTELASNAVETAKIKDSAVTTAKVNNLAITDAKINSVSASKVTIPAWTLITPSVGTTPGSYGNGALRYRLVGNHMYLAGGINVAWSTIGTAVCTLPDGPAYSEQLFLKPCSGNKIARIYVTTGGVVTIDWIRNISDATTDTSFNSWLDLNLDFWID